jgi:hypothetical protein
MNRSSHGTVEQALPYDPVEWSRRLDRARETRARVLAARAAGKVDGKVEPSGAEAPETPVLRLTTPFGDSSEQPLDDGATEGAEAPACGRRGRRFALGLATGLVAGTAAALLAAV